MVGPGDAEHRRQADAPVLPLGAHEGFEDALLGVEVDPRSVVVMRNRALALVKNGDRIEINIPARKLQLKVSDGELKARRKKLKMPKPKITEGWMIVTSKSVAARSRRTGDVAASSTLAAAACRASAASLGGARRQRIPCS